MHRRILLGSGISLGLCLIVFWMTGFAGDSKRSRSESNPDLAVPPPSQPYLSTGFPQVVVVSGTDREMGIQYGEQAAAAIVHKIAVFKSRLYDSIGSETTNRDMQVWDYYLTKHDPAYGEWLQGIIEGCRHKGYEVRYLDSKWIQGMGWVYSIFGKSGLPNKKLVDEVVPDRPVYLLAYDGHTSLANSKALQAAGITRKTPNPPISSPNFGRHHTGRR